MTGSELFAVLFLFTFMFGAYICIALEYGVLEAIVNKIIELVEARRNKKKDI